ncbi:hypothetical protein NMQ03_05415 [Arthrobacter sp. DNA4]|uniref:hypothetical protein n=1 Tax=Arthrobacter sp. DNA4 TaxID=2963432 RepID=UPI0020CCBB93|nr:hypothetical protein [Arthrobacter sp. DNA4]UTT70578.1 hypothetical protein NMQ03_05415 [Arthrobacter sp. DNA4]
MIEPTGVAADAATIPFNLPDYRVISTTITAGRRQVVIETDELPGCLSCGVIASRRKTMQDTLLCLGLLLNF